MKASVTNGPGEGFVREDIDIDEPIGAEVLVQIRANGLCRSDLSVQADGIGASIHSRPCWAMSPPVRSSRWDRR